VTARVSVIDLSPPGHQPRSLIVLLRARKDGRSAQYYARRLVPPPFRKTPRNPYVTKALGAVSLERAKELAWQWWNSTEQKINGGQSLREESFSRIAESYLETLELKSKTFDDRGRPIVNPKKYKRHEQCIRLHLTPFFGPMAVGGIRQDDSERWLEWRVLPRSLSDESDARSKVSVEPERLHLPARSTIQKDGVAFAAVIRHARLHFKVDTRFIPDIPLQPLTEDTRRPRFYPDEWQRIKQALYERMNSRTGKSGPLSAKSWWFRIMLFYFVITLHGTGLRVAEATRLKVKHLKRVPDNAARSDAYRKQLELAVGKDDKDLSELDRGKTINEAVSQSYDYRVLVEPDNQLKHYRHHRAVVPLIEMTSHFDSLLTILALNLPAEIIGDVERPDQLPPDVWLFCHLDGRRIKSFDNGFDEILKDLKLLYHSGKKRSLTSIRHTYASERIEVRKAELKAIADNMGTTLEMLYRHYSQEIRELRAADLQISETR
jgi:hypothetical protein